MKLTRMGDIFFHKSLAMRYIVLPLSIIALLWTLQSFSYEDPASSSFPASVVVPYLSPDSALTWPTYEPPNSWQDAAQQVKTAFLFSYDNYEKYAIPHDEIMPLSRAGVDNFNGWGVDIYDALDTMILMNTTAEFERAMFTIQQADFYLPPERNALFFETVIRHLGGLLSAYAMTEHPILREKADLLGRLLSPAFETQSGLPHYDVNTVTGDTKENPDGYLAELASCQPEYTYLAKITGKAEYYERVKKIWRTLDKAETSRFGGMLPTHWNLTSGEPIDYRLTVGGQADSAHEYLLKQYLLTARTDKTALEMYLRMSTHVITRMLYLTPSRHILYPSSTIGETGHDNPAHDFEHLDCFLPGLFALGAHLLPLDDLPSLGIDFMSLASHLSAEDQRSYTILSRYNLSEVHMWAARGMAEACSVLYFDQPSGLSPDIVLINHVPSPVLWINELERWREGRWTGEPPGVTAVKPKPHLSGRKKPNKDYGVRAPEYELRPETLESLWYMWRITGEEKWRLYGWEIWQAIEKHAKTEVGYSSVQSVETSPPRKKDSSPSYFLAETLKYLYLLFSDEDFFPLDKWVFNTEAHPLPVFEWTQEEKEKFGIP